MDDCGALATGCVDDCGAPGTDWVDDCGELEADPAGDCDETAVSAWADPTFSMAGMMVTAATATISKKQPSTIPAAPPTTYPHSGIRLGNEGSAGTATGCAMGGEDDVVSPGGGAATDDAPPAGTVSKGFPLSTQERDSVGLSMSYDWRFMLCHTSLDE
ncbi:MAG: hypothetical protein EPO21_08385 [Chloroflexota bacterium]|nr:MAG: hypothetical protein EPO21_08385 [Chloroflexota bacterium]